MHLMSEDLRIIIGMAFAVHNNIHGEKIPIKTPKKSLRSDKKMRRDTPLKKNHSRVTFQQRSFFVPLTLVFNNKDGL